MPLTTHPLEDVLVIYILKENTHIFSMLYLTTDKQHKRLANGASCSSEQPQLNGGADLKKIQ